MSAKIVGLGQRVGGDDAVGLAVLDALRSEDLPAGVEALEARDPSALVELVQGARRLVIVDAVLDEERPGSVRVLDPGDVDDRVPATFSSHGVGVIQAVRLGATLAGVAAPDVKIVGVGIRRPTCLGEGLSDEVAAAVPDAARVARDLAEG